MKLTDHNGQPFHGYARRFTTERDQYRLTRSYPRFRRKQIVTKQQSREYQRALANHLAKLAGHLPL